MAIYTVTTSNWNSAAFWSWINQGTSGHTLDFSGLGSGYSVTYDNDTNRVTLSDGATTFVVGDTDFTGTPDATLGGTTIWDNFTTRNFGDTGYRIVGGFYGDLITSGAGNDTIFSNSGADTINAGDGDNVVYSGGENDTEQTGSGADEVYAGSGQDTVNSGGGNDYIDGGDGADSLNGGAGDDQIDGGWGDAGADTILAGSGNDLVMSGAGNDFVQGEAGADWIDGGLDNDTIQAGIDEDRIVGDAGNDQIFGGDGNDVLTGGAGADSLYGDNNDDAIWGAAGDFVDGGAGNDTLYVSDVASVSPSGGGNGTVFFNGGGSLSYTGIESVVTQINNYIVDGTAGADQIGQFYVDADGDWIDNDDILGSGEQDSVLAGAGDDTVWSNWGSDTVLGGDGADSIYGGDDNDVLYGGGFGAITDIGGSGLVGETWPVILLGNTADLDPDESDAVSENAADLVGATYGGFGAELYNQIFAASADDADNDGRIGDNDSGNVAETVTIGGVTTTFDSTQDYWATATFSDGTTETFYAEIAQTVTGDLYLMPPSHLGDSNLLDSTNPIVSLTVDSLLADDAWVVDDRVDHNYQLHGADTDGSNDTINGDVGDDTIVGGGGDDSLDGGADNDLILGGSGNDTLVAGNNTGLGDTLVGGTGDDVIYDSFWNATLEGGDGSDLFHVGYGAATVSGGEGGSDQDTLSFAEADDAATVILNANEAGTYTDSDGDNGTFTGIEAFELTSGNDFLDGGTVTAAIEVFAGSGNDQINGGAGADSLDGEAGNDTLLGGGGQNDLFGNDGDDSLVGQATDVGSFTNMYGGAGADTLDGALGGWDIANYCTSADGVNIDLNDALTESGGDAQSDTLVGVEQIDGSNFADDTISGGNFVVEIKGNFGNDSLLGGSNNNIIYGGDGSDYLFGNSGDDTLDGDDAFATGGADTILGGFGNDEIIGDVGNDVLDGGAGNDTIFAGDDADTIWGQGGADQIYGENDADLINIQNNFGNDTIVGGEGVTTGTDYDTLDLSALTTSTTVTFTGTGAGTITDGADTITFSEIERIILSNSDEIVDLTGDTGGMEIIAANGADSVTGGTGGDTIDGGAGNDTVDGGAGNDSILGSSGNDTLLGGDGDDTLADSGSSRDLMDGGAGNDQITGGSGDTLIGGDGDDTVTSTSNGSWVSFHIDNDDGNDVLVGYEGAGDNVDNLLFFANTSGDGITVTFTDGESGTYSYNGVSGTAAGAFTGMERLDGTLYDDVWDGSTATGVIFFTVYTNGGNNLFTGSAFNDGVTLQGGSETVFGGDGDDYIDNSGTEGGDDLIDAGAGNDTIEFYEAGVRSTVDGGTGNDAIWINNGDITYVLNDNFGNDTIASWSSEDDVRGGDGIDASALSNGVTLSFTADTDGTLTEGANSVIFEQMDWFTLTNLADVVNASVTTNGTAIAGLGGTDSIIGGSGNDTLDGGDGNDTLRGGTRDDKLLGGLGRDTLEGGAGANVLDGGDGDDHFYVTGADTVVGGTGDDQATILDGFDGSVVDLGGDAITVDSFAGGEQLDLWDLTSSVSVTFTSGTGGTLTSGAGESLTFSNVENFVTALDQDLYLDARLADWDLYIGDIGTNSTIYGSAYNDTIEFGGSVAAGLTNRYYDAGAGDDYLFAGNGDDTLLGGLGNDTIDGSEGNESLVGGAGDDLITGWYGADTLIGSSGNDTLYGQQDADTFIVEDGFGTGLIFGGESVTTGVDFDVIDLRGLTTGVAVNWTGAESGTIVSGADTISFSEIEQIWLTDHADSANASSFVTSVALDGLNGNDTLIGGAAADTITGGDGDDSISGGDGNDFLKTGQGQDTLDGGDGDDTLMNSAGDDSLVGGAGADSLVASAGNDTLIGGAGNDTLYGGTGGHSLDGGANDDLLLGDMAGVEFNATGTDGVGLASGIADFPTTQLTYEVTFAGTNTGSITPLGSYAVGAEGNEFFLYAGPSQIAFNINGGTPFGTGIDPATVLDGTVHTIALTWDSATGAFEVFVDGISQANGTYRTGVSLDQGGTFALGQDQDVEGGGFQTTDIFEGTIYGARLYNDIRTDAEILDSVEGPIADTSDPNIVANWVANPDSASFTDLTGSHAMVMSGDVAATWSSGDDALTGGTGNDTIYGGGGQDTITFADGFGTDSVEGGEQGTDFDTLDFSAVTGPVTVTFTGEEAGTATDGTDTITFSEIERIVLAASGDTLDATITTNGVDVDGLGGDDTLTGGSGSDTLAGGTGNDSLYGGAGGDGLTGGDGQDRFHLEDGFGADTITGGEGATDLDSLDLTALTTGSTITATGAEAGTVTNGADTANFSEIERIYLSGEGDYVDLTADNSGSSVIDTGVSGATFGQDTILTGDGADSIDAWNGDDSVDAGGGNDTVWAYLGNDTVDGGAGNDLLLGESGNDSLTGNSGDDTLIGDIGADTLAGGTGLDSLTGGDDGDTFIVEDSFGNDTIVGGEGVTTGTDFDTIDLSAVTSAVTVTYSGNEAGSLAVGGTTSAFTEIEALVLTEQADTVNAGPDGLGVDIDAAGGDDSINSGSGNDSLQGGAGADTILADVGDDTVEGGAGNDSLEGNAGRDIVSGGAGDDSVFGGQGQDTLSGDAGNDTLSGDGNDDSVTGGAGTDSLLGGAGNDTLEGGQGADTISGGNDNDLITGDSDDVYQVAAFRMGVDFTLNSGTFEGGADGITLSVASTGTATFIDNNGAIGGDVPNETFTDPAQLVLINGITYQVLQDDTAQFSNDANGEIYTFAIFDVDLDGSGESGQAGEDGTYLIQIAGPVVPDGANLTAINGTTQPNPADYDLTGTKIGYADSLSGGAGDDTIEGGFGDDTIAGGTGNDSLSGGGDADTFVVEDGFGTDTITGGETTSSGTYLDTIDLSAVTSGVTLAHSGGEAGTVTEGANSIGFTEVEAFVLTEAADSVDAAEDTSGLQLDALGGDDTITTGSGDDSIDAGQGRNLVDAGLGNDTVLGGSAQDTIDGGAGADDISGGSSEDSLTGGLGDDTLFGGGGHDTLVGGADNDSLYGDANNDSLLGGTGSDTLVGGIGLDILDGGQGADRIDGGADNDTINLTDGFGNDTVLGGETGLDTADQLNANALLGPVAVTYSGDESGTLTDGTDTVSFSEIEQISTTDFNDTIDATANSAGATVFSQAGDDTILGGSGNDSIEFGDGNNSVVAGDGDDYVDDAAGNPGFTGANFVDLGIGNDTAFTGYGDDTVLGGDGNDVINVQLGNDSVDGGLGDDSIINEDGASTLLGGGGNDTITGGTGGETIGGGAGNDSLSGGADADTFVVEDAFGNDTVVGGELGTDNDVLDLSATTWGQTIDLTAADGESGTVLDGFDTITFSEIEEIALGSGDDTLTLADGGGAFTVSGFEPPLDNGTGGHIGQDVLDVSGLTSDGGTTPITVSDVTVTDDGSGNAVLSFPGGESITLVGVTVAQVSDPTQLIAMGIPADDSDFVVSGDAGDNLIDGSYTGDDELDMIDNLDGVGGTNADSVDAGDGADTVIGGQGDDTIDGGSGNDSLAGGADNDSVLGGLGDDWLSGNSGNDTVDGGDGNDSVFGAEGDDSMLGGAGNDSMEGWLGNDTMDGGADNDYLDGADGNDLLYGGTGADLQIGAGGDDTFHIEDLFGQDTIQGGETGEGSGDVLEMAAATTGVTLDFTALNAADPESGTFTDGTDTATFTEIERFELTQGDDTVIAGTSGANVRLDQGNDLATGGVGNDSFFGEAGNDTLIGGDGDDILSGNSDNDSLDGGLGNDTLDGGSGDDILLGGDGADSLTGFGGSDTLSGGAGADILDGGAGNDVFNIGSGDTATGGGGDDVFNAGPGYMTGAALTITGGEGDETPGDTLNVTGPATITMTGAEAGTVTWLDGSVLTFSEIENVNYTACFTANTRIKTARGEVKAIDIREGDMVLTRDNGYQPVRWAGCTHLSLEELQAAPDLRPVRIAQGALDGVHPTRPMLLSPQHRVVLEGAAAELYFGEAEVLAAAVHLLSRRGIRQELPKQGVTYVHFMFDRHELVMSDGTWTESFQPGDRTLAGLDDAQRDEIFALFPELATEDGRVHYGAARMALRRYQTEALLNAG